MHIRVSFKQDRLRQNGLAKPKQPTRTTPTSRRHHADHADVLCPVHIDTACKQCQGRRAVRVARQLQRLPRRIRMQILHRWPRIMHPPERHRILWRRLGFEPEQLRQWRWHQPTQQQLPICPRWRCVYRCTCTRVRVQGIECTLCEDI